MYGSHDLQTVIELSMSINNADADVEKREEGRLVHGVQFTDFTIH